MAPSWREASAGVIGPAIKVPSTAFLGINAAPHHQPLLTSALGGNSLSALITSKQGDQQASGRGRAGKQVGEARPVPRRPAVAERLELKGQEP